MSHSEFRRSQLVPALIGVALLAGVVPADVVFSTTVAVAPDTQGHAVVASGDFNKDGHVDLISAEAVGFSAVLTTELGAGNGSFVELPAGPSVGPFTPVLAVADFDTDGDLDLLTRELGAQPLSLTLGAGDGSFAASQNLGAIPSDVVFLAAAGTARLDDDALPDIVLVTGGSETSSIPAHLYVLGNVDGTSFELRTSIEIPFDAETLALGDLDGDGRPDAAVSYLDGSVETFFSTPLGQLAAADTFAFGSLVRRVVLADVDRDQDLDMVVLDSGASAVKIRANDGAGVFGAASSVPVSPTASDLRVLDVDGDHSLDLLVIRLEGNFSQFLTRLDVHRGFCDGSFGPALTVVAPPEFFNGLELVDVDEDGLVDLATSPDLESVAVATNLSAGPTYAELGHGLAGTPVGGALTPRLDTVGSLETGELACWTLRHALPGSTAYLIVGFSQVVAPFKAGVLVPAPDVVTKGLPVNAQGQLELSTPWPAGGSGLSFASQFWIQDPGGPVGWAASSAVSATIP